MNRAQRIVLVLYCLLLAYCCIWIPWHVPARHFVEGAIRPAEDLGYGWLWVVPNSYATPDLPRIELRFGAATALAAAVFLISGISRKTIS